MSIPSMTWFTGRIATSPSRRKPTRPTGESCSRWRHSSKPRTRRPRRSVAPGSTVSAPLMSVIGLSFVSVVVVPGTDHGHRAVGVLHHAVADRAEQQAPETAAATAADDDQVGAGGLTDQS